MTYMDFRAAYQNYLERAEYIARRLTPARKDSRTYEVGDIEFLADEVSVSLQVWYCGDYDYEHIHIPSHAMDIAESMLEGWIVEEIACREQAAKEAAEQERRRKEQEAAEKRQQDKERRKELYEQFRKEFGE